MTLNEIIEAIGIEPYYREDAGVIYNNDCLDILPRMPEKCVDLVVTDPPYGEKINRKSNQYGDSIHRSRKATNMGWDDKIPDPIYFKEMFRISLNQIVFGANYFWENFYATRCYIIWDKRGILPSVPFAPTEFAWTSFNRMPQKYICISHGFIADDKTPKVHPTMKPMPLILSILKDFSDEKDIISDWFAGSGTTGVAAKQSGRKFIMAEIEEKYCAIAVQRLAQEVMAV